METIKIDIFIRSYPKDFEILKYCLISIRKNIKDYNDIFICVRNKDYEALKREINTEGCIVVQDHDYPDDIDYLGQQLSKINADIWSNADYILFMDSDCICYNTTYLKDSFFSNEKLIILKDYWKDVGQATCWKKCLNDLKILTEFEFMRRLPQIYPRNVLPKIRQLITNKTSKDFINGSIQIYKKSMFSEFNIIGSYMYLYDNKNIDFLFSKNFNNKINMKQLWSHTKKDELIREAISLLNIENPL